MADTHEHHNRHKDLPEQKDKPTTAPLNEAPHHNGLATAGVDNPADRREVKEG